MKYTPQQLDDAAIADMLIDARCADGQVIAGPFYPDRGITAESLRAYAAKCRAWAESRKSGGAHKTLLAGEDLAPYEPCAF